MPEIIRFSNDRFYDKLLIPLRQYGPERLPPLEHVFIEDGYREGSGNRVVNRPEANVVVEKILELCGDKRYSGKTMGVVVLQGEAQAGLIQGELLDRLGAEEMARRRLICGNSYSFQGDERDIMFLSMVAAPDERIGPLTRSADERRFNVAASRARDQMILFHSVTVNDLSESDLRRKLLEFFENTKPQEIAGIGRREKEKLERRAAQGNRAVIKPLDPFDSWFEVDVALEIARKGYIVQPQFEFAGRRIDLVIEGGQARLAVECDGDTWHGPDQYEKDMERQRQLERCGWEFFRVRESAFYANKEVALEKLWPMLEERGIFPASASGGGKVEKAKVKECEKAKSTKPPFELISEPPNNRQKPRVTDGEQRELDFEREDAEVGKDPRSETDNNDSWNTMKFDTQGKVWWQPKGELGKNECLMVLVPEGITIKSRDQYLAFLQHKIEALVQEVMDDPIGMTGKETSVAAVQWILDKTIPHQVVWQPSAGTPKEWAHWILDSLEASDGWTTIKTVTHVDSDYEKAKEQDISHDAPLEEVLYTLMAIAY